MSDYSNEHDMAFGTVVNFSIPNSKLDEVLEFADQHEIGLFYDPDLKCWSADAAANDLTTPEFKALVNEYLYRGGETPEQNFEITQFLKELQNGDQDSLVSFYVAPKDRYSFETDMVEKGFSINIHPISDMYEISGAEAQREEFSDLVVKHDLLSFESGGPTFKSAPNGEIDMRMLIDRDQLSDVARGYLEDDKLQTNVINDKIVFSQFDFSNANDAFVEKALSFAGNQEIELIGNQKAVVIDDNAFGFSELAHKMAVDGSLHSVNFEQNVDVVQRSDRAEEIVPRKFVPIAMGPIDNDILDLAEAIANDGDPKVVAAEKARVQANAEEIKPNNAFSPISMDASKDDLDKGSLSTAPTSKLVIRREGTKKARVEAAKQNGEDFIALYGTHGFHVVSDKTSSRYQDQMNHLRNASAEEIRIVASVSSDSYSRLTEKENNLRLFHAIQHDPEWKARYEKLVKPYEQTDAEKAANGKKQLLTDFGKLSFSKMKELGSLNREGLPPIGLVQEDRFKMISLDNGYKALREVYAEKTGTELGRGIMDLASRAPKSLKMVDNTVKLTVKEELEKRKAEYMAKQRQNSSGVER